ncbi:hypothetical protein IJT17_03905 [bacterium]|nr:hypothetical protein [bacterium]
MPSFPCEACGAPVEITGHDYDVKCKKCGDKRPFKCSKCQRRIGLDMIYHPERLTFKKPIFCQECGSETDFVQCSQCTQSLMRANSVEKIVNGDTHFYHKECYISAIKLQKRVLPVAAIALAFIVGYLFYMLCTHWSLFVIGGIIGIFAGKKVSDLFAPK